MIKLSEMDTQRFNCVVAKGTLESEEELQEVSNFCDQHQVDLLIARIKTDHLALAQALERQGAFLTDVLVYYLLSLIKKRESLIDLPSVKDGVIFRACRPEEANTVSEMARECFQGYYGHYHSDHRLNPQACDDVYIDWARRSCLDKQVADEVLVAEAEGQLIAFATIRMNSPSELEGVLFGVAPVAQGRGIYRSLIQQSMAWGLRMGAKRVVYSTQINNLAVQKVWVKEGCEPSHSYYTFHKWFSGKN